MAQEARVADARQDPDVAAILQRFPGAKITDVRIKVQETEDGLETDRGSRPSRNPPRATSCPATISNTSSSGRDAERNCVKTNVPTSIQKEERPMRDIMGMMGKVKEMQAKMEKMQEEIAALEVERHLRRRSRLGHARRQGQPQGL
jgi:hypothetical protein